MSVPDPLPRRSGSHKLDLFVGACALLVSAVSLFIGWQSNQTQQRMLAASVWPYLSWNDSNADEKRHVEQISFSLDNAGVGPAKVEWMRLRYNGQLIRQARDIVDACCKDEAENLKHWNMSTGTANPSVVPAHDQNQFFALERNDQNGALWDKLNRERFKLRAEVCYCSVLEECWMLDTDKDLPQPVSSCAAAPSKDEQYH